MVGHEDQRDEELRRLRLAAEDALQQLDWCIGYLHGIHKNGEARVLARNRTYIRKAHADQAAAAPPPEPAPVDAARTEPGRLPAGPRT